MSKNPKKNCWIGNDTLKNCFPEIHQFLRSFPFVWWSHVEVAHLVYTLNPKYWMATRRTWRWIMFGWSLLPPNTESEYRPPPPLGKDPPLPGTNERSLLQRCKSCAFYAFCAFFSSFFVPVLIFANQLKHFFTFLSRGVELDLVIFLIFQNFSNYFFMDSWHQIVSLSIIIIEMIIVAL